MKVFKNFVSLFVLLQTTIVTLNAMEMGVDPSREKQTERELSSVEVILEDGKPFAISQSDFNLLKKYSGTIQAFVSIPKELGLGIPVSNLSEQQLQEILIYLKHLEEKNPNEMLKKLSAKELIELLSTTDYLDISNVSILYAIANLNKFSPQDLNLLKLLPENLKSLITEPQLILPIKGIVTAFAFNSKENLLAAAREGFIEIIDITTKQVITRNKVGENKVTSLVFFDNDKKIAYLQMTAQKNIVFNILNIETGEIKNIIDEVKYAEKIPLQSNNRVVAFANNTNYLYLYDAVYETVTTVASDKEILSVTFNPSVSNIIALTTGDGIEIWNVADIKRLKSWKTEPPLKKMQFYGNELLWAIDKKSSKVDVFNLQKRILMYYLFEDVAFWPITDFSIQKFSEIIALELNEEIIQLVNSFTDPQVIGTIVNAEKIHAKIQDFVLNKNNIYLAILTENGLILFNILTAIREEKLGISNIIELLKSAKTLDEKLDILFGK